MGHAGRFKYGGPNTFKRGKSPVACLGTPPGKKERKVWGGKGLGTSVSILRPDSPEGHCHQPRKKKEVREGAGQGVCGSCEIIPPRSLQKKKIREGKNEGKLISNLS